MWYQIRLSSLQAGYRVSKYWLGLSYLLFYLCAGTAAGGDAGKETVVEKHLVNRMLELTSTAEQFRLKAIKSEKDAFVEHGIADVGNDWASQVAVPWNAQKPSLDFRLFFANALVVPGAGSTDRAAVAFYNPWLDFLLATEWRERAVDGWKIAGFTILSGEHFRGEQIREPSSCPAWILDLKEAGTPVSASLGKIVKRTMTVFRQKFPLGAPLQLPVVVAQPDRAKELALLKTRFLFGAISFEEYAKNPDIRKPLEGALADLTQVLKEGSKTAIMNFASAEQDAADAKTISLLPEHLRTGMMPTWIVRQGPGAVLVITNPLVPPWFMLVFMDFSQKPPVRGMRLYDFGVLADYVK